jgi:hypothetical protein
LLGWRRHQCDGGGPDGLPCGGGHRGPARKPHESWWREFTSNHSWINQAQEWLGPIKRRDVSCKSACGYRELARKQAGFTPGTLQWSRLYARKEADEDD